MDTIDKLIALTKSNQIEWNEFTENVYRAKVDNIKIELRNDIIEDDYSEPEHIYSISVKVPDKFLETIKGPQYQIEELYMTISKVLNISSINILNQTLTKMIEKTEDLVGTTKNFNEPFEFKFGAKVKAWNNHNSEEQNGILIGQDLNDTNERYYVAFPANNEEGGDATWFSNIEYLE